MSNVLMGGLPALTELALHARVPSRDSLAAWQRVGTLYLSDRGPEVTWDADARHLAPLWERVATPQKPASARDATAIRFAVSLGRRTVVVAEGWVPDAELARLRRLLAEAERERRRRESEARDKARADARAASERARAAGKSPRPLPPESRLAVPPRPLRSGWPRL